MIHGARCAFGPKKATQASIWAANGRVTHIANSRPSLPLWSGDTRIDLSGFLLMPGIINAHDHLQFALHPRLADPPHRNYIDWGIDIHKKFPDVIAKYHVIPKEVRLWWGGLRNLLCGVTTVCHHDFLWSELRREDFPIRVVQRYGWAHSFALGGNLSLARTATPEGGVFVMHACEGVDEQARQELFELDRLKLLDDSTVLVHGLAIDAAGVALLKEYQVSLILCPSSNMFLFGELPKMALLDTLKEITLGNDSPLTAVGDFLDEIQFAVKVCGITPDRAYRMVTETSAFVLRLEEAEGTIKISGRADLIAIRDTGEDPAIMLQALSINEIEFVMIGGHVQLASKTIMEQLPSNASNGLEPLCIDGIVRWLRAPVKDLLHKAEEVLGKGEVRLGGRRITLPVETRSESIGEERR